MNESNKTTNSVLFQRILEQNCEIEEQWKQNGGPPVSGLTYEIHGVDSIQWKEDRVKTVSYSQLRERLELEKDGPGRKAVCKLDDLSPNEFSVEQVVYGCAHALWFHQERQSQFHELRKVVKAIRDKTVLSKNRGRAVERARNRAIAACTINPSLSTGVRLLTLSRFSEHDNICDNQMSITFNKYGCAYYQRDRMTSSKHPYPWALLALNLEYIFRHWPVSIETFPSSYPKKQQRGSRPEEPKGAPRLDIVANFIDQLFPFAIESDSTRQIKEILKDLKTAGALFCGW